MSRTQQHIKRKIAEVRTLPLAEEGVRGGLTFTVGAPISDE